MLPAMNRRLNPSNECGSADGRREEKRRRLVMVRWMVSDLWHSEHMHSSYMDYIQKSTGLKIVELVECGGIWRSRDLA